jgi:formate dehydrogenase subunit delta
VSAVLPPEIRLGNDIARQVAHLPREEAVEVIATHVQKFWEPRMRRRLRTLVASGAPDADPLLVAAALGLRDSSGPDAVDPAEVVRPSGG